ncbi:MAG: HpcH/HpaI aldolase [Ramlibacter sp.]|jgi:citrate lyase subunit beta/citryl-CoA lyase|nr:HpcH/HpaI aldolase [Ramlibacter sp.]MDF2463242.1 HpcH/HpaI aldolase [Ramlibacter sp.]
MLYPRSFLFVPGDRPERFDKALRCGAEAVILDLEDAVGDASKDAARDQVGRWLAAMDAADRARVAVRLNGLETAWFEADAAMVRAAGARMAMLPKAESSAAVARLRSLAGDDVGVLALIETARGVRDVDDVAAAAGVVRLAFGTVDYTVDMGLSGDPAGFDYAAARIAVASRACGLAAPIAGVTLEIADTALVRADVERARVHGFGAKLCIHPQQVAAVHEALAPSAAQVDWAQRVLAAAQASPQGALQVDGRMVDRPVLERARTILGRRS